MAAVVVLAAGESRRTGPTPKALLPAPGGRAVVRWIVDRAEQAGLRPVVVVVGAHAAEVTAVLTGSAATLLPHETWALGRTGSVKRGLLGAGSGHGGTLLWPVDHPFIASGTIQTLLSAGWGEGRRDGAALAWLVPSFEGHRGHPVLIGDEAREEVLSYPDNEPLFRYPRSHPDRVGAVPVQDPGVSENTDTLEAYELARARFERDLGQAPPPAKGS